MKLLSINKDIVYESLIINSIKESELLTQDISSYDYIIINGGDGTIRRVMKALQNTQNLPPFILNPTGSFNVIAKLHRVPKVETVLKKLAQKETPNTKKQNIYSLNKEVFLFSAGNMGDLQHIFLAETLRFGILKNGIAKYALAVLLLLPAHLILTPFMLLSKRKFFIFTPASFISKFGSFYGKVEETITIDLTNNYNLIELDGDVVTVEESILEIKPAGDIDIVV
jgi:hypothetical protein